MLDELPTQDPALLAATWSAAGLAVASLAGSLLYANRSFLDLFDLESDAVATHLNIRSASNARISAAALDAVVREGQEQQICISWPAAAGKTRELLCTISRVMRNGIPAYLVLTLQDATLAMTNLRQMYEQALQWSTAQRLIGAYSWRMNVDERQSDNRNAEIDWSPQFATWMADSTPPATLRDYLRLVAPEDRDGVVAAINGAMVSDIPYAIAYDLIDPAGVVHRMLGSGAVLADATAACGRRLVGIEVDTSRTQICDAHELLLNSLLGGIDAPIYVVDRKFHYLRFNPAHAHLMRATYGSQPHVGGSALEAVLDPAHRRRLANLLGRVFKGERMAEETEFAAGQEEPSQWFDFCFTPIRDRRHVITGAVAFGKDISVLKRAHHRQEHMNAELAHRVEQRTAELNVESRRFNTFLVSTAEYLLSLLPPQDEGPQEAHGKLGVDAGDLRERPGKAVTATTQVRLLAQDLLQLSSIDKEALRIETIDMDGLMREILQDLAGSLRGRNIVFDICRLPTIEADRALLRQVFRNLLSNAVRFSAAGMPVRIHVRADRIADELVWSVADNGVGFGMHDAEKVFAPFVRLHPELDATGTGLGLTIVKRAVERLNGRIWAESSPDKGATFHCTLNARREGRI